MDLLLAFHTDINTLNNVRGINTLNGKASFKTPGAILLFTYDMRISNFTCSRLMQPHISIGVLAQKSILTLAE